MGPACSARKAEARPATNAERARYVVIPPFSSIHEHADSLSVAVFTTNLEESILSKPKSLRNRERQEQLSDLEPATRAYLSLSLRPRNQSKSQKNKTRSSQLSRTVPCSTMQPSRL